MLTDQEKLKLIGKWFLSFRSNPEVAKSIFIEGDEEEINRLLLEVVERYDFMLNTLKSMKSAKAKDAVIQIIGEEVIVDTVTQPIWEDI